MPELPEVESLRRILARTAVGRTIVRSRIGAKSLRRQVPIDFSASIAGRRITKLSRRAKYLIVEFDGDDVLLVHLFPRVARGATAELKGLGPEPLSRQFNAAFLASKARRRRVAIKNLLMD